MKAIEYENRLLYVKLSELVEACESGDDLLMKRSCAESMGLLAAINSARLMQQQLKAAQMTPPE